MTFDDNEPVSDNTAIVIICGMIALLIGGFTLVGHSCAKRTDDARLECVKQGRVWISQGGDQPTCLAGAAK